MTAFLVIAGMVVLGSLGLVVAPMLRGTGRGVRRASYDMQVYRDQLREIEADRALGRLSAAEADATRAEVARRLIAAADAEAADGGSGVAPARVSRGTAAAVLLVVSLGAGLLYDRLGAPFYPDQPLALRLAGGGLNEMNRPSQAEAEAEALASAEAVMPAADPESLALIARLEEILAGRPDDLQGHRLLARSLASLGRLVEARSAQERVVELLGPQVQGGDLTDLAELMIFAAGGYVSPETGAVLAQALALDPAEPRARYYSGLGALQAGRPDIAYPLWARLLEEVPPGPPWREVIAAEIDEVARLAGVVRDGARAAGPTRSPSPADVDAAAEMSEAERAAMIEGMVAGLAGRLAAEGGPPEDWAQLIRALVVLGRAEEAAMILTEARAAFAEDAAGLALIDAAGAGVGP